MRASPRHFQQELQELLDHRLAAAARAEVEEHLQECAECRREFVALRWTKAFAAEHFAATEVPADLEKEIVQALRAEERRGRSGVIRPDFWLARRRSLLLLAAAIALAAFLAGGYFLLRRDLPESLARSHRAYKTQALVPGKNTSDLRELEICFSEHGVAFQTRGFDLRRVDYQLAAAGSGARESRSTATRSAASPWSSGRKGK